MILGVSKEAPWVFFEENKCKNDPNRIQMDITFAPGIVWWNPEALYRCRILWGIRIFHLKRANRDHSCHASNILFFHDMTGMVAICPFWMRNLDSP